MLASPIQLANPLTISYTYDGLYRLIGANYSDGKYYHYTYNAVGNRISQASHTGITTYGYDIANRLTSVDSVPYTWDDNGNLLSDGVNTYTYDSANRLAGATDGVTSSSYTYNGMGDRLQQTVNSLTTTYALDLNTGLTQVLQDGTYSYLYGNGRIAQLDTGTLDTQYFLGDALGSVRQLAGQTGSIVYAASYSPYGEVLAEAGTSPTSYGYTGELTDSYTGMVYLRSRYYRTADGRFLNRDTWAGNANDPGSFNRWAYVQGNPINFSDPTGMYPLIPHKTHIRYCSGLRGDDLLYCYRIALGIDPEEQVSFSDLYLYDVCSSNLPAECACDRLLFNRLHPLTQIPLQDSLPTNAGRITTPIQNGWWFHVLLDKAKGVWNNFGRDHVYFRDVISYAMSVEMSTYKESRFQELMIEAFANKGSSQGMYFMVGGRQSVITRVATAVGGPDFHICGPHAKPLPNGIECFQWENTVLTKFAGGLSSTFDPSWGRNVMLDYDGRFIHPNYNDAAWDFGNVTQYTLVGLSLKQAKKHEFVVGGVPPVNNRSTDRAWFGKVFFPIRLP